MDTIKIIIGINNMTGEGLEYLLSADGETILGKFYNGNMMGSAANGNLEVTKITYDGNP